MSVRLRVGMGDSYGLRFTVLASPDFHPEDVTGATFMITKPTAVANVTEQVEWTGVVAENDALSATATYAFNADGSDLDFPGSWRAWVQWTVPGESPGPRSEVARFVVIAADAV